MAPPRRAETDRRSSERFRCEFATGDVQELNRKIQQGLRRQACVTHDAAKPCGASRAEDARQFDRERQIGDRFRVCARHASACKERQREQSVYHCRRMMYVRTLHLFVDEARAPAGPRGCSLDAHDRVRAVAQGAGRREPGDELHRPTLALVAIVIGGLLFMCSEAGAKRQIAGIVFGRGLTLFAAQFLAWLFRPRSRGPIMPNDPTCRPVHKALHRALTIRGAAGRLPRSDAERGHVQSLPLVSCRSVDVRRPVWLCPMATKGAPHMLRILLGSSEARRRDDGGTRFVALQFSQLRATIQRDYPDSLFFLDPALADATMAHNDQSRVMEAFLTNPSGDETDIDVKNVTFGELSKPPYKASVDFDKRLFAPGTRQERTRETYVAQMNFVLRDAVPNAFIRVNPLGIQITYVRVDQAFEEPRHD
jgi:hypothetical protein